MSKIVLELSLIAETVRIVEDSLPWSDSVFFFTLIFKFWSSAADRKFIVVIDISQHIIDQFFIRVRRLLKVYFSKSSRHRLCLVFRRLRKAFFALFAWHVDWREALAEFFPELLQKHFGLRLTLFFGLVGDLAKFIENWTAFPRLRTSTIFICFSTEGHGLPLRWSFFAVLFCQVGDLSAGSFGVNVSVEFIISIP